ncbi:MAG: hypothetical protein AAFX07_00720 [Pseudomonadota bacterium]
MIKKVVGYGMHWVPPQAEQTFAQMREDAEAEIRRATCRDNDSLGIRNAPFEVQAKAIENLKRLLGERLVAFARNHQFPMAILEDDVEIEIDFNRTLRDDL